MVTYMVNPDTGDDGTADGTAANPYRSIAVAVDAVEAAGGGEVVIMDGEYDFTESSQIVRITTAATPATAVTIRPETPYGVKINFSIRSCFEFQEGSSYITLEGLEIDGNTDELRFWSIVSDDLWADNPNEGNRGGGLAVILDGEYITVRDNYIHDAYQKGVEIRGGRYVVVEGNIISGIATTSLSGGHGIMRQQKGREFFTNDIDGQYRWDIRQNLLYNIEQRIYSWVASKGFLEMTIDEGKSILIDDPKDDQSNSNAGKGIQEKMSARITDNIVAFGAVDHIRLKSTPGLEVSYNTIYAEGDNADGITDKGGDTDTPKFVDFRFIGNVARTNTWVREVPVFSLECDNAVDESTATYTTYATGHTLADHEAGSPQTTTVTGAAAVVTNNLGYNGRTKPRGGSGVPGLKEEDGEPFVDPLNGNFRLSADAPVPSGITRSELGVRGTTHDALDAQATGFGVAIEKAEFETDNRKLSQTIFDNIPGLLDGDDSNDSVLDGSGFFFGTHNGERTFTWPVVDGEWANVRRVNLSNTPNMEFRLNEEYLEWYEEIAAAHPNQSGSEYERIRLGDSELTQDQIFDADWLLVSEITGPGENTVINAFDDQQAYDLELAGDILIEFLGGYVPEDGATFDLILAGTITPADGSNLFDRIFFEGATFAEGDYTLEVVSLDGAATRPSTNAGSTAMAPTQALRLTVGVVLPVELTSFTGERNGKNEHVLTWETAWEENSQHFDLQRSATGVEWSTIATFSANNTAHGAQYAHTDASPLLGANLYRLRQVDTDGTATLSHIVTLANVTAAEQAFPNPFADELIIPMDDAGLQELSVYTLDGRNLTSTIKISLQGNRAVVRTENLPTGTYVVVLNGRTQIAVKK